MRNRVALVALLLSVLAPGAGAATCATLVNSWGSPQVVQLQSTSVPAGGLEACALLYMTGAEYASIQEASNQTEAIETLQAQMAALQAATTPVPFNYAAASSLFGFFFSFTVGCWLVAKNAGLILEAIKRW